MMKAETKITQDLILYIKYKYDGDAFHVHGSALQRGGEPDISGEIMLDDEWRHLKIEVKTPEGEPSARQLYRLKKYHERGYVVGIVTNKDELVALLNAYRHWWQDNKSHRFADYNLPYREEIYGRRLDEMEIEAALEMYP